MLHVELVAALREPNQLFTLGQLVTHRERLPLAGFYSWWSDTSFRGCVSERHPEKDGHWLFYVGIGPSRPGVKRCFADRLVGDHVLATARKSTVRRSLGCMLAEELDLQMEICDCKGGTNWGKVGESRLTAWMEAHCRVGVLACERPWEFEAHVIRVLDLSLNLKDSPTSEFRRSLSNTRLDASKTARMRRSQ